eukprot:CAMPEP_0182499416 /NCGR_PEP_ID=MMETSP1321-20130603/7649_1 /TAXON_ID=91990 /ORGANISM="Bolidomonas sp., Strain RCC1657" /LENGTH=83 /DNA_ID=CAMNT_0024703613 /DNA_START=162 /DNA_END=410 /DNA_ORIENTATION=+
MTSPSSRQSQHDLRILKNSTNAASLNSEWNLPVRSDAFLLDSCDPKIAKIKEERVEVRRLGKNVLNDAVRQAEEDVVGKRVEG